MGSLPDTQPRKSERICQADGCGTPLSRYDKGDYCQKHGLWPWLPRFRRDLVADLYQRRGPLWDTVLEVRERRGIDAVVGLPPSGLGAFPCPEGVPDLSGQREPFAKGWGRWAGWLTDLRSIEDRVVPARLRKAPDWPRFIAVCVLYDPPEPAPGTGLMEFAECAGAAYDALFDVQLGGRRTGEDIRAPELPIRELRDPAEVAQTEWWLWGRVLDQMFQRHLAPRGLGWEEWRAMVRDVLDNTPWLWEEYAEKVEQNPPRPYIEVLEDTRRKSVEKAFAAITATHRERPTLGIDPRDRLTTIEAAILHRKHGFTYEQLADRYGWDDPNLASKYIKAGENYLNS